MNWMLLTATVLLVLVVLAGFAASQTARVYFLSAEDAASAGREWMKLEIAKTEWRAAQDAWETERNRIAQKYHLTGTEFPSGFEFSSDFRAAVPK